MKTLFFCMVMGVLFVIFVPEPIKCFILVCIWTTAGVVTVGIIIGCIVKRSRKKREAQELRNTLNELKAELAEMKGGC